MRMFELAHAYRDEGMLAYSQASAGCEFDWSRKTATAPSSIRRFVGAGYFDEVAQVISSGNSSITALAGSTEEAQFHDALPHQSANLLGSEARA